jgi:2-dehydro-3-deoxyphosphogluconate aldolase / (4S)-4-hydroxy-2-oxoglutarate aldolase
MSNFTKAQVYQKMAEKPLLPLFYHSDLEFSFSILEACYRGGVRVFEFTNRGEGADKLFEKLVERSRSQMPEMAIGIGTIYNAQQAQHFIDLDADFIVQPFIDEEVATICNQNEIAWIPGTMTFSEIHRAQTLGSEVVKLFPGNIVGPDFLKAMKGPMPNTKVLVTGGVEPNQISINTWMEAGAFSLGLGSQLFTKKALADKDFLFIEQKVAECFNYFQKS